MLTQTIPSLVNALSGSLPEPALRALTQALGNCNQPLTHRSNVQFVPRDPPQNGPGAIYIDRIIGDPPIWPPEIINDINDLLPDINSLLEAARNGGRIDLPGWRQGNTWNTYNYGGDIFNFPVNQEFNTNNYYGGPTIYNAGNQYTNNQYTNNHTTNNIDARSITVQVINGQPVGGPAGPPGAAGAAGPPGADGEDGRDAPPFRPPTRQGRIETYTADVDRRSVEVVTGATFDPESCEIQLSTTTLDYVTQVTLRQKPNFFTYYGP